MHKKTFLPNVMIEKNLFEKVLIKTDYENQIKIGMPFDLILQNTDGYLEDHSKLKELFDHNFYSNFGPFYE